MIILKSGYLPEIAGGSEARLMSCWDNSMLRRAWNSLISGSSFFVRDSWFMSNFVVSRGGVNVSDMLVQLYFRWTSPVSFWDSSSMQEYVSDKLDLLMLNALGSDNVWLLTCVSCFFGPAPETNKRPFPGNKSKSNTDFPNNNCFVGYNINAGTEWIWGSVRPVLNTASIHTNLTFLSLSWRWIVSNSIRQWGHASL